MTTDGPAALNKVADTYDDDQLSQESAAEVRALAVQWAAERAQAAADRAEIASCLENIRELTAQRLTRESVIADVREELHIGPGVSVVEEAGHVYMQLAADRAALSDVRMAHAALGELFDVVMRERDKFHDRAERAEAALKQARALLGEFYDDSPCRLDHHGYCQEHSSMANPCIMRRVSAALSGGAR